MTHEQRLLNKEIIQDWLNHPGTKLISKELHRQAKRTLREQLEYDPYTEADKIMKAKQLRHVIGYVIPKLIEQTMNYHAKEPWFIIKWIKKTLRVR